jgi:uncharacterized protein YpiB (UPF0302 family)
MKDINNEKKASYIRWFLRHYQPRDYSAKWLMDYIAAYPAFLSRVKFISDYRLYEESIFISSKGINKPGFLHKKGDETSQDLERYYYKMKRNDTKPIYIEIQFPFCQISTHYLSILEDDSDDIYLSDSEKDEVEQILEFTHAQHERTQLLKKIDNALDDRDIVSFESLSSKLKAIDQHIILNFHQVTQVNIQNKQKKNTTY